MQILCYHGDLFPCIVQDPTMMSLMGDEMESVLSDTAMSGECPKETESRISPSSKKLTVL